MSQQDAAKQQANTRNNIRVVSISTAAAIGLRRRAGDPLTPWQLPPFTRHSQFTDNALCARGSTHLASPQVNGLYHRRQRQRFRDCPAGRGAVPDRRSHL